MTEDELEKQDRLNQALLGYDVQGVRAALDAGASANGPGYYSDRDELTTPCFSWFAFNGLDIDLPPNATSEERDDIRRQRLPAVIEIAEMLTEESIDISTRDEMNKRYVDKIVENVLPDGLDAEMAAVYVTSAIHDSATAGYEAFLFNYDAIFAETEDEDRDVQMAVFGHVLGAVQRRLQNPRTKKEIELTSNEAYKALVQSWMEMRLPDPDTLPKVSESFRAAEEDYTDLVRAVIVTAAHAKLTGEDELLIAMLEQQEQGLEATRVEHGLTLMERQLEKESETPPPADKPGEPSP